MPMIFAKNKVKKRPSKTIVLTRIIFILVIFWFVGNGLFSFFLNLLIKTEFVQTGVIEKKIATTGFLIRDEKLIYAPFTGELKNKYPAGNRIEKDGLLFTLESSQGSDLRNGQVTRINAPVTGIVSYYVDGLEEILNPQEVNSFNFQKIEKIKEQEQDLTSYTIVEEGKAICKITNNLEGIQLVFQCPLENFPSPLNKNQILDIRFPTLNKETRGKIIDLKGIGKDAQIIIKIPFLCYDLMNGRVQEIEIILNKKTGISLPRQAIVFDEIKGNGVYYINKGFVFWKEINIIAEEGDCVLVKGLDALTEVVLTPKWVKEGQYLY